MGIYLKRFIYASLIYLGLAVVMGILSGMADIGYVGVFAHTHFNLLGFMAMMVFGIGYFILPRFNGVELSYPEWVPVHFWLGNISLVVMIIFRGLMVETGESLYSILFVIMASLQSISIFMFIINMWVTLNSSGKPAPAAKPSSKPMPQPTAPPPSPTSQQPPQPAAPTITVGPDTRVGDLIDVKPSVQQLLIDAGVKMLAMPGHIDKVRQVGVTLGMVANNHGLDLDDIIAQIKKELEQGNGNTDNSSGLTVITPDTLIGKVIDEMPATRAVFQKYFGDGCFDCPGQAYESIDMACRMHGVDPKVFLEELNKSVR